MGELAEEPARETGMRRLLQLACTKKVSVFFIIVFAVFSSVLELAPYVAVYLVLERLLTVPPGNELYTSIIFLGLLTVGLTTARYVFLFLSTVLAHIMAYDVVYNLRSLLLSRLGTLPMGYLAGHQTGKIKKLLYEDVEELEVFMGHHIPDIVSGIAVPLVTLSYLFFVDWRLALVALLPLPVALILQRRVFGAGEPDNYRARYHDSLEAMNGTIVEYVKGMPVVKVFNQTVESFSRLKAATLAYTYFIKQITLATAPSWATFVVVSSSGFLCLLPFGLWLYLSGTLPLPDLLLFLLLGAGYLLPVVRLARLGGQLQHILEGLKRAENILNEPVLPECEDGRLPADMSIAFTNVSFSYDGKRKIVDDVSFTVQQGSVVALVGPSGSGKSTLAQLLLRMWDVSSGSIAIGGVDIRDMSTEALMRTVSFVFQDSFLFSDTLRENIRMGMPEATEDAIVRAASAAQCADFIQKLPKGLDTHIGEGGEVHLSGGERQRVALARIFLKDSPIIVLDEATAYADADSESRVQQAFSTLMRGKTVIIIAHRLSTITDVDTILVVSKGKIVEQGTHEELLTRGEIYGAMWAAHTQAGSWKLSLGGEAC